MFCRDRALRRGSVTICSQSSEDHDGTATMRDEAGTSGRIDGDGSSKSNRGFGFVVRRLWVIDWKSNRRKDNHTNSQHRDRPMQALHRKEPQVGKKLRLPMMFVNVKTSWVRDNRMR